MFGRNGGAMHSNNVRCDFLSAPDNLLSWRARQELAEEATAAYRRLAEKLGEPDAEGGEDDEAGE